jgi:hypothetical protein
MRLSLMVEIPVNAYDLSICIPTRYMMRIVFTGTDTHDRRASHTLKRAVPKDFPGSAIMRCKSDFKKLILATLPADRYFRVRNEPSRQTWNGRKRSAQISTKIVLTLFWRFEKLALHTEHNRTK